MSRTLIFGGTFNPVHVGHLRAAVEAAEALGFGAVEWIPSYAPRHKGGRAVLPFALRVALLRAAVAGHAGFRVNDIEKDLPAPSLTIQTLEALTRAAPQDERHFLLGDREFLRLHTWVRGRDVAALAHMVIVCRTEFDREGFAAAVTEAWPQARRLVAEAGTPLAFELVPGRRAVLLPLPRIEISASLIRRRWLEGRSIAHLMPGAAIDILEAHRPQVTSVWGEESPPS